MTGQKSAFIPLVLSLGAKKDLHTLNAIADAAGLDRSALRKIATRNTTPSYATLIKLAAALEVALDVLNAAVIDDLDPRTKPTVPTRRSPAGRAPQRDVPVMGTAMGSTVQGAPGFRLTDDPVEYVARPPGLTGVINAYAFYVQGDSMWPAHPNGQIRFVNPNRPPAVDDTVVIQTRHYEDDPGQAYIKIYKKQGAERLVFEQINPKLDIEIPRKYIVSVHKVLTMNEIIGV